MMNPEDPESAHRIVSEYMRLLEQADAQTLPASVRALPYPKQTIKAAILTCTSVLRDTRQLTAEMHQLLEDAYAALADYVDEDVVRVMAEYRQSMAAAADVPSARDRLQTAAWHRMAETSRLAGEIARTLAEETATLRSEFRAGTVV